MPSFLDLCGAVGNDPGQFFQGPRIKAVAARVGYAPDPIKSR